MSITYTKPRRNEYGEWEAKAWKNCQRYPDADVFDSTRQDVINTVKSEYARTGIPENYWGRGYECGR